MKINITIETLKKYEAELKARFNADETIAIPECSHTQFSVARFYGGCTFNGKAFIHNPTDDSLIRSDVVKFVSKLVAIDEATLKTVAKHGTAAKRKRATKAEDSAK